jgi:GST-like protein
LPISLAFPWLVSIDAAEFLSVHENSNVLRWAESLVERPAVQRGRRVNSTRSHLPRMLRDGTPPRDFESQRRRRVDWVMRQKMLRDHSRA